MTGYQPIRDQYFLSLTYVKEGGELLEAFCLVFDVILKLDNMDLFTREYSQPVRQIDRVDTENNNINILVGPFALRANFGEMVGLVFPDSLSWMGGGEGHVSLSVSPLPWMSVEKGSVSLSISSLSWMSDEEGRRACIAHCLVFPPCLGCVMRKGLKS